MKKDKFLLSHIDDMIETCRNNDYNTVTDFLDMHEQSIAIAHVETTGIRYRLFGGYESAERRLMTFLTTDSDECSLDSVRFVKVTLPKLGVKRQPNHRDYLGALMNLGVERKLLGDILVMNGYAIIVCRDKIADFLVENFTQVGSITVHTTLETSDEQWRSYRPDFNKVRATVASVRLDGIIKAGSKLTRSGSVRYIKSGKVFVNSKEIKNASHMVEEGDIISVRGIGKFRLTAIGNETKKGRLYIEIDIYK